MRLIVLGGCGYIGSVLVPKLVAQWHLVRVIDSQLFGNSLPQHDNLKVIKADIREPFKLGEADAIIHLANIANDPSGELDPKITWEVNALAMAQVCDRAIRDGVKQFIYASSGSVYGVSNAPKVNEETPLVPLTEYNKTKMVAERVLLSYADKMSVQILRPGTCCGVSPRQRLDITVNGMTIGACTTGALKVVNGSQFRPNVHIQDLTNLFVWMLERPKLTGIWNAGFENVTGNQIADIVSGHFDEGLEREEAKSPDRRSYRMDSSKLLKAGFKPKYTVRDAVSHLIAAFDNDQVKDEDRCYNLRVMRMET